MRRIVQSLGAGAAIWRCMAVTQPAHSSAAAYGPWVTVVVLS